MRLDKYLANNSEFSRSQIRRLAKAGEVHINGQPVSSTAIKIAPKDDVITISGQQVHAIGNIYIMLHKPIGVVCATSDSEHPTVKDLLFDIYNYREAEWQKQLGPNSYDFNVDHLHIVDLQVVGRLDIDTTGLVLMTNDGQWNHKVTAPSTQCNKTYLVETADPIDTSYVPQFSQGVMLDGEKNKTRAAELNIIDQKQARLTISEGKYHQVKRMFASQGNRVVRLHRESIGNITLDDNLEEGQYRLLSNQEAHAILAH